MRSLRTVREGSVGLLFLVGLGVFGLIFLWLNRFTASQNSYKAFVEFANAGGMQKGAAVRFRGVKVGRIASIKPGPNNVEVEIEINQPNLIIPRDVVVEANQSGLIAESLIDIFPKSSIPEGAIAGKPLEKDCDEQQIVCNGSRLQGKIGISIDEVLRSTNDLAVVYSDPKFYSNLNKVLEQGAIAAANVAELSKNLSVLSKSSQSQFNNVSGLTTSLKRTANQVSVSTSKLSVTADRTLNQFGTTANQFNATATQLRSTSSDASRLLNNLDSLVTSNRSSLVSTLNNISESSNQLRVTVNSLSPSLNRLTQGELIKNLETLSANAAQASANLRDATKTLNDPKNAVVLQQTLDSARVTFENTQKITSDLDELTGDPKFRTNLRQLVNGLSGLVSSSQQIEQQVQVAQTLDLMKANHISTPTPTVRPSAENQTSNQIFPTAEFSQLPNTQTPQQRKQAVNRLLWVLKKNSEAAKLVPQNSKGKVVDGNQKEQQTDMQK
ncbi:MlaD family protein [Calothrix sp. UHCC 0171]|uniref:MlaD family protein n=1 Tax=Calothrix sp. UHCC 0171 TaxID=3110245 RepID=UPI002B1FF37E|nr:MlaD family protein [Calothrix sp. UHCC 0171]MEA5569916.1 MlaD family protein [Calothrix sp. UHCC 0171]